MKNTIIFLILFIVQNVFGQIYNVTFQVNMSNESSISNTVSVAGNFQSEIGLPSDYFPGATLLTDANQDLIYSITVQIPQGSYQYKYFNGATWGNAETIPAACETSLFREITVNSDTVLAPICFGTCIICPACVNTSGTDVISACNNFTWIDGNTYNVSNNTATHTLTNAAGCDSIVTLNLTINKVSDLNTSLNSTTIMALNPNATYQWLNCNNNYSIINGETIQTFIATSNGNYAVELTENGCIDTSACVSITNVNIDELDNNIKVMVYPNPTKETVRVILEQSTRDVELVITDLQGKIISKQMFDALSSTTLTVPNAAGIYFLTIRTNNHQTTIKLKKE